MSAILTKYDLYDCMKEVMKEVLPHALEKVIPIYSKIDALPDYPTQKEAGAAIGVSTAQICKMFENGVLTPLILDGIGRRRVCKKELKTLMINRVL